MARTRYFVVLHKNEWKIKFNGEHYGPYPTQRAAIRAAIDTAHKAGENGLDTEVLVQGLNHHQFRTEWTYGHAPFLPSN
jgi:hypothetical protein